MDIRLASELLLLLLIANGTPVLAGLLLRRRWAYPLDGGRVCRDGRRLFGASKTVRGLLAALLATALLAAALGLPWWYGALFAGLAMSGDTGSSYLKRRLGYPSSCASPGLDQLPESLLPLLLLQRVTATGPAELAAVTVAFAAIDLLLSRLLNPAQPRCR